MVLFTYANQIYVHVHKTHVDVNGFTFHRRLKHTVCVKQKGGRMLQYSYADACRNIFNTIRTSLHSSLEKYTTHFIRKSSKGLRKVLCVKGELETEQNCNILTPNSFGYNSISFLFSWAVQTGASGTSLCWNRVLIPASSLQLTDFLSHPGYIIILRPPTSCDVTIRTQFNPSPVKVIPWYLRPDAPVIYTGAFLIWQPGRVGGQYVIRRLASIQNSVDVSIQRL